MIKKKVKKNDCLDVEEYLLMKTFDELYLRSKYDGRYVRDTEGLEN